MTLFLWQLLPGLSHSKVQEKSLSHIQHKYHLQTFSCSWSLMAPQYKLSLFQDSTIGFSTGMKSSVLIYLHLYHFPIKDIVLIMILNNLRKYYTIIKRAYSYIRQKNIKIQLYQEARSKVTQKKHVAILIIIITVIIMLFTIILCNLHHFLRILVLLFIDEETSLGEESPRKQFNILTLIPQF